MTICDISLIEMPQRSVSCRNEPLLIAGRVLREQLDVLHANGLRSCATMRSAAG
jgi:hypothetical protein